MDEYHTSVLLQQVLDFLKIQEGEMYIDATLGGGGHTKAILDNGGKVLGIDVDEDALVYVRQHITSDSLTLAKGNFSNIGQIARENGYTSVAGILFDLGVSSHQLDTSERGFSFLRNADLDMRMDKDLSVKASDLVNGLTKQELTELFTRYGEEPFAGIIAKKIVENREIKPILATGELADIVARVYRKRGHVHPATKVFQALRLAVNDELNVLKSALPEALELLKQNGRLVVISFHSLEDRIVKEMFLQFQETGKGIIVTGKPMEVSEEEKEQNNRARSAKMRVFEKRI